MSAKLVHKVVPKYPQEAKEQRIEGTVRLQILVDADGKVIETKLLDGPSILVKPATEAVRKWRYKSTLLNGKPVQVVTEVDSNFTLHE